MCNYSTGIILESIGTIAEFQRNPNNSDSESNLKAHKIQTGIHLHPNLNLTYSIGIASSQLGSVMLPVLFMHESNRMSHFAWVGVGVSLEVDSRQWSGCSVHAQDTVTIPDYKENLQWGKNYTHRPLNVVAAASRLVSPNIISSFKHL